MFVFPEGAQCAIGNTLFRTPPVPQKEKVKLPEVDKYSRDQFYRDIKDAKAKKDVISALHKAMTGQHPYYSRMPLEVRNAIIKGMR